MKTLKQLAILLVSITVLSSCSDDNERSNSNCSNSCEYTIASNETAGTVPSSIHGTFELTMTFAQTGSPIADGTTGTFTVTADELTVEIEGMECITIKNPIQTSSAENTFIDTCRDNYKYSVSTTPSGDLNEINLSKADGTFLGQFK